MKHVSTEAVRKAKGSEKVTKLGMVHSRAIASTFIDPSNPTVGELKKAKDNLHAALTERDSIFKTYQSAAKKAAGFIKAANKAADDYGKYVDGLANINDEVANDAGLEPKVKTPDVKELAIPAKLVVEQGEDSGHLLISFDKVEGATHYEIYGTNTPNSTDAYRFLKSTTNTRNNDVNSFTAGQKVAIKVRAMGRKGLESKFTREPVVKFVA